MERFRKANETDIILFERKAVNENTSRSTNTWLNLFISWADCRNMSPDILSYSPADLNDVLRSFYAEIRKNKPLLHWRCLVNQVDQAG